jgi:hypothetical protein
MNRSYNRTVLECGGYDTAFESNESSNSNGATPLKAVSRGLATALQDASAYLKVHGLDARPFFGGRGCP